MKKNDKDTAKSTRVLEKEGSPNTSTPRRSGRNKTVVSTGQEHFSSPNTLYESPALKPLNIDKTEGFVPSKANDLKFKYDSPSGLRAEELDALLKPPPRPKNFPADLASEKVLLAKSYKFFGQRPKANAASQMVEQMELKMKCRQEGVETAMAEDDRCNEVWSIKERKE
jgi:hypothetical protein